ncbi:MAG: hypothetical protein JXQ29_05830 [Planctomycetes bacterium]|nr:hypothetical protein [Planctomycetota bacterium]
MGRVLAGAALAALVITAVVTVQESVKEMRHGSDQVALAVQKERLERIQAKLIEEEAALSGLRAVSLRAATVHLPLRVPGLPDFVTRGARDRPLSPPGSSPARSRN